MAAQVAVERPTVAQLDKTHSVAPTEVRLADILAHGDVETALENVLEMGIHPWQKEAFQMKGMMHMRRGRWAQAEQVITNLCSMWPEHLSFKMMGDCQYLQCRYDKAEEAYRKAMALSPNAAETTHDLGVALISQGRMEEGLGYFQQAISMRPERADFRHHHAIMLILAGHEKQGWEEMQWRIQVPGVVSTFPDPEKYWKGEDLTGKNITLRSEQGWGDTIQFACYLPEMVKRAKKVTFWCQRAMVPFVQKYYPDVEAWPNDSPPRLDYDYHVNLMCLPRLCPDWYTQPKKQEYPATEGIGVCWFGSPTHKADHLRSVPIERFGNIAKIAGGKLKCLGYGRFNTKPDFMEYYINDSWDWSQTAEYVKKLDLVITVDTAMAHLAGFIGVECWLLLPYVCDFRWGLKGETTKWYESVKIYRQPKLFDWDSVFAKVEADLAERIKAKAA